MVYRAPLNVQHRETIYAKGENGFAEKFFGGLGGFFKKAPQEKTNLVLHHKPFDGALQTVEGQGEHGDQLGDGLDGGVEPGPFR